MTLSTQDKLAKIREALAECDEAMHYMSEYDIPLCMPDRVKAALLTVIELQEELKPKEIDVEKVAEVIYKGFGFWGKYKDNDKTSDDMRLIAQAAIAEIAKQLDISIK